MEEYDNIKISRKHKIRAILISSIVFLISVIGVTYAYFSLEVEGNEEASSMIVNTAGMEILFEDSDEVIVEQIFSGDSIEKTFLVTNTGTGTVLYDIKIADVFGTFINDELVYTLEEEYSEASTPETIMPSNDGLLKAKISIAPGVTHIYTLTLTFKETGSNQNYNQIASYRGKIQIISPYTYSVLQNANNNNIKFVDRIFADNTAYPTNVSSKYVTEVSGINYANPSDSGYNGYYTDEETVSFTSNANKCTGTTFSYDATSGNFKLTGSTPRSQTYSTSDVGKYTCNGNAQTCGNILYKIVDVDGSTVTRVERYVAKPDRSYWNGLGLYYTNTNTVDNKNTYFFRGHVTNNYVSFASDIWRIVRINEDGSIKMIRQANARTITFNGTANDAMYVGYMYGTSGDPYTNDNNSYVKTQLEAFYDSYLASSSAYLADIEFCNDRTNTTSDSNVYYGAYTRLYTNKTPQFTCPNETRDLFTMTSSSRGNKKLTKSIGLLTQDEAVYAGAVYDKLSRYYLDNGATWMSSSPYSFVSSTSRIWYGYVGGGSSTTTVNSNNGVRPVISLKDDVMVSGGTGAVNDPYVIVTN